MSGHKNYIFDNYPGLVREIVPVNVGDDGKVDHVYLVDSTFLDNLQVEGCRICLYDKIRYVRLNKDDKTYLLFDMDEFKEELDGCDLVPMRSGIILKVPLILETVCIYNRLKGIICSNPIEQHECLLGA